MASATKILYLHGFASGPRSTKGVAFEKHFAEREVAIECLNLRVPTFERLRLSAMIETVTAAIGDASSAILIGSSLGGLTAARVAEREPRVQALVLMAPAFQLVARWQDMLGVEWDRWRETGWREVPDHASGGTARVDFGFVEDVAAIDVGYPDVRVPTLIFHGTKDDTVPVAHSRTFAQGRPHVRLVELDDGHELIASLPTMLREATPFVDEYRR